MTEKQNDITGSKYHKTKEQLEKEVLLIKSAQDDPANFQPLYEEYFKVIFNFIYRRTSDEQLTADITSTVFLKALVNIKKFVPRSVPFSSWLYRIAMNEVNLYFRKNRNSRTINYSDEHLKNIAQETEVSPDIEAEKKLLDAISKLPSEAIQLIEMRFFEDKSFAEIADIYGITEANAKMKVYRILEKLKHVIGNKSK